MARIIVVFSAATPRWPRNSSVLPHGSRAPICTAFTAVELGFSWPSHYTHSTKICKTTDPLWPFGSLWIVSHRRSFDISSRQTRRGTSSFRRHLLRSSLRQRMTNANRMLLAWACFTPTLLTSSLRESALAHRCFCKSSTQPVR